MSEPLLDRDFRCARSMEIRCKVGRSAGSNQHAHIIERARLAATSCTVYIISLTAHCNYKSRVLITSVIHLKIAATFESWK